MKNIIKLNLLILFLVIINYRQIIAKSENLSDTIVIENADYLYLKNVDNQTQVLSLEENVRIKYSDYYIKTNKIFYKVSDKILESDTVSEIITNDLKLIAQHIKFDLIKDYNEINDVKIKYADWHISAKKIELQKIETEKKNNNVYKMYNGIFTTCSEDNPHYYIFAKYSKFSPNEYVKFYAPTLKLYNIPIFWFPYFHKRFDRQFFKYELGYRKKEGGFILTDVYLDAQKPLTYTLITDYYNYRGLANGAEIKYDTANIYSEIFGYYINEKPLVYDINTGRYNKVDISRRERWKLDGKINANFSNNLNIKGYANINSDYLVNKDYKERFDGYIKYDNISEFEFSQNSQDFVWHITIENQQDWQDTRNKFVVKYKQIPNIRFMYNKQNIGLWDLIYQPDIYFKSEYFADTMRRTIFGADNSIAKNFKIADILDLKLTTGLKLYRIEYSDNNSDLTQSDYFFSAQNAKRYKKIYNLLIYDFSKNYYNVRYLENYNSSVNKNKLTFQQYYDFDNINFYLNTGYDFSKNIQFSNKKQRIDNVYTDFKYDISSTNKLYFTNIYNLFYKKFEISAISHKLSLRSGKLDMINSLNYLNPKIENRIYQWQSQIHFNILKNNIKNWQFKIGHIIDLNNYALQNQNIEIIKDLHCLESVITYTRDNTKDFSIYLALRIKSLDKYGLGMQYNDAAKSIRLRK
ncbi:MAG TPA: hypothetical protein PLM75_06230 [bacterium]|nr:hypothetical protein [bacterium]